MDSQSVLFLCTGNSARSQMAEGFLRAMAGDRFEVFSAGLEPRGIHPMAVKVMAEKGIDISGQESKNVDRFLGHRSFQHVFFVCRNAEDNCPSVFPFALRKYSWPLEDPARAEGDEPVRLAAFRLVRDDIELKLKSWLAVVSTEGEV